MNKEYIKINDNTIIVSDENGNISIANEKNEKLLIIENKIEAAKNCIQKLDENINSIKDEIEFNKIVGIILCICLIGSLGMSMIFNIMIFLSSLVSLASSIILGDLYFENKKLKKNLKNSLESKNNVSKLIKKYEDELFKEKELIKNNKKDQLSAKYQICSLYKQNEDIYNIVNEQINKTFVKKLIKSKNQ